MKVKSVLYDEASGSIGSITAANSQGGTYFKIKPQPSNPNTDNQRAVRDGLAGANSAWTGMTEAARTSWGVWSKTLSSRNQVGATVSVSAWAAFSGAFVLLSQAGRSTAPLLLAAPLIPGYASSGDITASVDATDDTISLETKTLVSRTVQVYVSGVTKTTINNYGGSFNYALNGAILDGTNLDLTQTVTANQRRFIRLQTVGADGRYSKATTISVDG